MNNELIGFTSDDLRAELRRRSNANEQGKCDACGRWYDEERCSNNRHGDAADTWYRRWKDYYGSSYLRAESDGRGLSLSISRYGAQVSLFPLDGGNLIDSTELPDKDMADRDRIKWAVDWAESHMTTRVFGDPVGGRR